MFPCSSTENEGICVCIGTGYAWCILLHMMLSCMCSDMRGCELPRYWQCRGSQAIGELVPKGAQ